MYHWLSTVCRSLRESADVKLSQIAAAAERDQSAIYRFEAGLSRPRDIEAVVAAYAQACGIQEPQALWADALHHWVRDAGQGDPHIRDKIFASKYAESSARLVEDNAELHDHIEAIERLIQEIGQSNREHLRRIEIGLQTIAEYIPRIIALETRTNHNGHAPERL